MLSPTRTFTVDFTVTEASSKYICLNYDLETSEVVCPFSFPIASNNGLKMTCIINGATQLFLDSSDVFLGRSDCLPPPAPTPSSTASSSSTPAEKDGGSSSSSGISLGAIIGIVIGAVAGSILISVGGYILYKKFAKTKAIKYEVK